MLEKKNFNKNNKQIHIPLNSTVKEQHRKGKQVKQV